MKVAFPAKDISSVNAVISDPLSTPLKNISLLDVVDFITKSVDELVNSPKVVPPSFKKMSPPSASKMMSVVASSVIDDPESISVMTGVVIVLFVSVSVASTRDTVPVASGKVIVLSAVGFVASKKVSLPSSVEPSKMIASNLFFIHSAVIWLVPVGADVVQD